ncbi:MAG TPA: GNAT family N-acetyltransferase [Verrucomicrobiae bacterium]|nr:GNAT family N-acetyltransferase [Verrucomicrobiae bacterium]
MTNPNLKIREATVDDVRLILGFIRKKAAFDGVPHKVEATEARLAAELFGPQPVATALFAEISGQTVGFVLYFRTFSTYLCRPGIWLDDLFVEESARGHGIGKALLAHIAKIAADRGYGRVEWVTAATNTKGVEFYQRNGAQVQDAVRVLRLDREAISKLAHDG